MVNEATSIADKSTRLFDYLMELSKLRFRNSILSLDHYEKTIWFAQVPDHKASYSILSQNKVSEELSDTWLRIKKPVLKSQPPIPEALSPWVAAPTSEKNSTLEPALRDVIEVQATIAHLEAEQEELLTFTDNMEALPDIGRTYNTHIEKHSTLKAPLPGSLHKILQGKEE